MTAVRETRPAGRSMLSLTAALDAVALRVDQAGIRPEQLASLEMACGAYPQIVVQFSNGEVGAFEALLELFPWADRSEEKRDRVRWLSAAAVLLDGTPVRITVPTPISEDAS